MDSSSELASSSDAERDGGLGLSEDSNSINQIDQFLREALQNPRERLSVLRMEQEIEKFIQDPLRQQLEFQQLPTSYLRLAAHRVAQHYLLHSMVLLDNSLPDWPGSKIIVHKTSTDCRLPHIRLSDIPVNIPQEGNGVVKVAIKQRPQKHSLVYSGGNANCAKENNSKSVEERKEEYNRVRARIFNSSNHSGQGPSGSRPEIEPKKVEKLRLGSAGMSEVEEEKSRITTENDPTSTLRASSRVAIFRDREIERKDPDFDRSYDRYMQRFDPGFGLNAGPYTVQPMYSPVVTYSTESPQIGSGHMPHVSAEPPRLLPQHLAGPWPSTNPAGLGYGYPEAMIAAYGPNHVNARSATAIYMHSAQYPCQRPGMPFILPHEHFHQTYPQVARWLQFKPEKHGRCLMTSLDI